MQKFRLANIALVWHVPNAPLFLVDLAVVGSHDHAQLDVRANVLLSPRHFAAELLEKKSLILAPCRDTKAGNWQTAKWHELIASRLFVEPCPQP